MLHDIYPHVFITYFGWIINHTIGEISERESNRVCHLLVLSDPLTLVKTKVKSNFHLG